MDAVQTEGSSFGTSKPGMTGLRRSLRSIQLPPLTTLTDKLGTAVLGGVDAAVTSRWEPALRRADAAEGKTLDERVRTVTNAFEAELSMAGAAVGGAAALPGVGTTAAIGLSAAEIGWITVRLADLIMTIAALHGHSKASVEERRAWVLAVLAWGEGAATGFKKLAGELGKGLGGKAVSRIPTTALRSINKALGRTIVTKYGTKRGAIALGRALPFGIGAVIGATANYLGVRAVGRHADNFFKKLPYGD